MRKWFIVRQVLRVIWVLFGLANTCVFGQQLAETYLQRAQADVDRIRELAKNGTLPQTTLEQAEERLGDAQDELILSQTLYGQTHVQDMTAAQLDAMTSAAARRVEREQHVLENRQKLLDMGIISQNELNSVKEELASRRLVADLARDRVRLVDELRQMAVTEQRMELPTVKNAMIRYDGSAVFNLGELPAIEKDFKAHFSHDLPVSAIGQTMVHQGMGLDHRNKVDVALNPEQPEGLWLRHYLEKMHISYLAFRAAIAGAATAPHIHIGTGSPRLLFSTR